MHLTNCTQSIMDKSSRTIFISPTKLKYGLHKIYICFILSIVVAPSASSRMQTTRDPGKPLVTSSLDPAPSREVPLPTQAAPTIITTTGDNFSSGTTARGSYGSLSTALSTQAQPQRSLKFTLISGKYWKFNIKTNSFQNHREKELRLHTNFSRNNYIIDDDGWFQYNHQQQQLFAWPSYNTKPATYYFVLLPSGLDYEVDGENAIRQEDVVANIVVELIEPYTTSKLDLDHLVDHKFSLDYLHRHSSYALLLSQIVSIFDILSRSTSSAQNTTGTTQSMISETITTTTASPNALLATIQKKQARSSNRLSEFLLIDAKTSQDGEYFSLSWTTHPSLVNNAPLLPINDCRLNTINETVSKLSSRSALYPDVDSDFVISYSLEGPLVNSAAIIPTEEGNYALKLKLNGPCKRKKILGELGLSTNSGIINGLPSEADEKENGILDVGEVLRTKQIPTTTTTTTTTTATSVIAPTLFISSSHEPIHITTTRPVVPISAQAISSSQPNSAANVQSNQLIELSTHSPAPKIVVLHQSAKSGIASLPGSIEGELSSGTEIENTTTNTRRSLEISTTQASLTETPTPTPPLHLQFAPQPQPKSFANFLDSTIRQSVPTKMSDASNSELTPSLGTESNKSTTLSTILNSNATTSTLLSSESGQETTLNDDLMGILNDTIEYLVSIAVPLSIIFGIILVASILIAICSLCVKRRKSKQFEVGDRFKFRYGSERKGFLKNSSKPVILEADQKSLSMGGTPVRKLRLDPDAHETDKMLANSRIKSSKKSKKTISSDQSGSNFFSMHVFPLSDGGHSSGVVDGGADSNGGDCIGRNGAGGRDCGGVDEGACNRD